MSIPSCEYKLRLLALQNTALVSALTFTVAGGASVFCWFDRQIAQGDLGEKKDQRVCVGVQRISTVRTPYGNQGGAAQPLSRVRLQIDAVSYNAEQTRQTASLITAFMMSISLCDPGAWTVPPTAPTQNPNCLVNERGGMLPQLQPPAYVQTQDWFVFNREDIPSA